MNSLRFQDPTSCAFAGMKRILFQPFEFGKWFIIGFTAWIAGFLERGGSGGGGDYSDDSLEPEMTPSQLTDDFDPMDFVEFLPGVLVIAIFVILIPIMIVLFWVGSRGKFMFLDNVVHNRALVKMPWHEFRSQGNSLFIWRLVFWVLFGICFIALFGAGLFMLFPALESETWTPVGIGGAVVVGVAILGGLAVGLYIWMMLEDFVIPIMYKNDSTTNEAWRVFRSLHSSATGGFILYFLWKCLLGIVAAIGVVALALGTCCIGLILMIIPYIGSVFLLPFSVFFRLMGPEFLKQFGPEYDVFAPVEQGLPE